MQEIVQTIKSAWDALFLYLDDVMLSLTDFIKDLPALMLKGGMDLALEALRWGSDACSYCTGGATLPSGGGAALSVFATALQAAYDALSPCVLYSLTMSGMVANLQILSCAMMIWTTMRVFNMVISIL
ncbi:MAG: hypothetical protein ACXV74_01870 [Methylobacter sp.]